MAAGIPLQFQQEDKPITTVHITGPDGLQYEVKLALLVQAVIDSGVTNPIDGMPMFNIVAQTAAQVKRCVGLTLTLDTGGSEGIENNIVNVNNDHVLVGALIEKTANVVGESASISRTRIPVWTLEKYRRLGATDRKILEAFPSLRPIDLHAAWAYVLLHEDEIQRDIEENDAA